MISDSIYIRIDETITPCNGSISLLYAPNLVSLGRCSNCPICGFHACFEGFDFGLTLGLVSLFPLDTPLDIAAQGTTFWIGQYACSVKAFDSIHRFVLLFLRHNFFYCFHRVLFSPFFPAIVELDGQWLTGLGSRFGPPGIPAILEAIPIGVCVSFAVGGAHNDGYSR